MQVFSRFTVLSLAFFLPIAGDSPDFATTARKEFNAGRFDNAAAIYGDLIKSEPENATAYYG